MRTIGLFVCTGKGSILHFLTGRRLGTRACAAGIKSHCKHGPRNKQLSRPHLLGLSSRGAYPPPPPPWGHRGAARGVESQSPGKNPATGESAAGPGCRGGSRARGGGRSAAPEPRVMERVWRASPGPAAARAAGREARGRVGPPPRPAPPRRGCAPAGAAPPREPPARGCWPGAAAAARGGGGGEDRDAEGARGSQRRAAFAPRPRSPRHPARVPGGGSSGAAGCMRDLRGPRGGRRRLSTRGSRARQPWPPTLTT